MAIAYDDFMGHAHTDIGDLSKEDVSQVLDTILRNDTSFMAGMKKGSPAKNTTTKWVDEDPQSIELTGTYVAATNVLTISDPATSAGVLLRCRKGAIIQPKATPDWIMQFGSDPVTGANTMTVLKGTDADVGSAATFVIISQPYTDTEDASDDISRSRNIRKNFVQIFERAIEITKLRDGISMHAVANEFAHQTDLRLREMKDEIDRSLWHSIPADDSGYTADVERPMMMGFIGYVRDPDLDGTDEDGGNIVDGADAALTIDVLEDLIRGMDDLGAFTEKGSRDHEFWFPRQQVEKFSALDGVIRRSEARDKYVGVYKEWYISASTGLEFPIKTDLNLTRVRPDVIALVDKARIEYCWLQGDDMMRSKLAQTTLRKWKSQVTGSRSMRIRQPQAGHGLIHSLSYD